ncbi:hypothetical protein GCM10009086_30780 [Pseudomonas rhodesiae]
MDGLRGVFAWCQSLEAEAAKQALSGEQLKGMVLHQQDAKRVTGHKKYTMIQASKGGM